MRTRRRTIPRVSKESHMTELTNHNSVKKNSPSTETFVTKHWPWFLLISSLAWALWGASRVASLAVEHIEPIGHLAQSLRQSLPTASLPIRIPIVIAYLGLLLAWHTLPVWLFVIVAELTDKRNGVPLSQRILHTFKEVSVSLAGLTCLVAFWLCGILFLGFYGRLIDVIGGVIVFAVMAYAAVSAMWRSF